MVDSLEWDSFQSPQCIEVSREKKYYFIQTCPTNLPLTEKIDVKSKTKWYRKAAEFICESALIQGVCLSVASIYSSFPAET